jgi:catechol 2,3-dioxygenase-like lactoylglutathione lyase family enzyme
MTLDDPAFSHLGICVADVDRSLRFYCEGLGFEAAEAYDLDDAMAPGLAEALEVESPVVLRSQMITKGPQKIELLGYGQPTVIGVPSASRGQLGLTHLAFTVADVEATAAALVEVGGTRLDHTKASVGIEILFVADPDGTRIELMSV